MKSEHRHQLQTNVLADQTGKAIEQAKPFTPIVLGGIAVVSILGIVMAIWHNSSLNTESKAWTDFYFATGSQNPAADDWAPIHEDYPNTAAAGWARQAQADRYLQQGLDLIFRDKKQAEDVLQKASKGYDALIDSHDPLLRVRATFGLAQVYETMGDAEKATSNYKKLLQMQSVTPSLAAEVQRRIDWMDGPEGKAFFAWFKDYKPDVASPLNLPPLNNLPGNPNLSFPTIEPSANTPAAANPAPVNPAPANPGLETPAAQPTTEEAKPVAPAATETSAPSPEKSEAPKSTEPAAGTTTEAPKF